MHECSSVVCSSAEKSMTSRDKDRANTHKQAGFAALVGREISLEFLHNPHRETSRNSFH